MVSVFWNIHLLLMVLERRREQLASFIICKQGRGQKRRVISEATHWTYYDSRMVLAVSRARVSCSPSAPAAAYANANSSRPRQHNMARYCCCCNFAHLPVSDCLWCHSLPYISNQTCRQLEAPLGRHTYLSFCGLKQRESERDYRTYKWPKIQRANRASKSTY